MGEVTRSAATSVESQVVVGTDRPAGHACRVKLLESIVTCLQKKKPSWQKTRILHLSTQLEDSMFNSKTSLAEYGDTSTLSARINQHCRLLATLKTAAKPLAAANGGGLHSFVGTPMSGRVGGSSNSAAPGQQPYPAQPLQTVCGDVSAGEGDGDERAAPASSDGVVDTPPPYAPAGAAGAGAGAAMASPSLVPTALAGQQQEQLRGEERGNGSTSPRSSSHGETTEDDMDDKEDESDDGDNDKPGDEEVEIIATVDRSLRNRGAGGIAPGPMQEDERQHVTVQQQQMVEDVLAAASSLGRQTRNEQDGVLLPGKAPQVHELLEERHGYGMEMEMGMVQQRPKATEAEVKQHALRLLQSRLLLLTHASTCSEEIGDCRLAPLCDSVQQLLRHMRSCGNKKSCGFPHCRSSKAVLQHKHMCTDSACGLCGSVRDLSQKCFWANARHMHKRRLEESHEERRKKRQSEGKTVARPRKILAEKAKAGKECCSGLDEQGNDLGDISLGFFLRQDKAVKARKKIITAAQDSSTNTTVSANTGGGSGGLLPLALQQQQHGQGQLQLTNPPPPASTQVGNKRSHNGGTKGQASEMEPSQAFGQPAQMSSPPALAPSPRSPRLGHPRSLSVSWSSLSLTASSPPPAVPMASAGGDTSTTTGRYKAVAEAQAIGKGVGHDHDSEDVSGGGFEASSVEASSGGGDGGQRGERKAAARGGGGLTVVIPPVGSGAVVGHLRSPSEIMLDDIAESLADTSRKPSFARMQSVQAFLDDHVELRESASFGDVSAMVEQWMSLEDTDKNTMDADADNMDENGMDGMDAFSF
ncbi:unnamed protein product [Ectocarpus fasciculatus]